MLQSLESIPKIRVCIRKRPVLKKEVNKGDQDIIDVIDNTIIVKERKKKVDLTQFEEQHSFKFDFAYDEKVKNDQIYSTTIQPLVQATFQGSKTTCFAYGQTGSGKTFTMLGDYNNKIPGLYILAANDIFNLLQNNQFQHLQVKVSFYEIYCSKVYDLLNNKSLLPVREDKKQNINIVGLSEQSVQGVQHLMNIIEQGMQSRVTSSNSVNNTSSRSHAILQIALKNGEDTFGKINFIDLAGTERGADVQGADKQTRVDGAEINKSLLALKECIRALDQQKNHTPFRGSKLTLVLKDSFMGSKCKLVMIGNVSPTQSSTDYTLNTLRYSDRVKELKKPEQNFVSNNNFEEEVPNKLNSFPSTANITREPSMNFNNQNQLFANNNQQQNNQQVNQQINNSIQMNFQNSNNPFFNNNNNQHANNNQQNNNNNNNYASNNSQQSNNQYFNQQQFNNNQFDQKENEYYNITQQRNQSNQAFKNSEESVKNVHRQYMNRMIEVTKQEMNLVNTIESDANYDPQAYINDLNQCMQHKQEMINALQQKLNQFSNDYQSNQQTENAFKKYQQMQNQQPSLQNFNQQNMNQPYNFQKQQQYIPQLFANNNQNLNPNYPQYKDETLLSDER